MRDENAFEGYWRVYGGLPALIRSTYFWVAIVLTCLGAELWRPQPPSSEIAWAGVALDAVPSLLGFALGGMAIMLAFSSGRFLEAIRQKGKQDSYFMKMMAAFFHFAVVLSLALLAAFAVRLTSLPDRALVGVSCIGFFFTIYGVLLVMATVASVWHTARIFNAVREHENAS